MSEITKAEMRQRLGNIDQLKDLLFGEQITKYETKIATYEQRISQLETNVATCQDVAIRGLKQLETKLVQKIDAVSDSLEKKMQYLSNTQREEHHQLDSQIKEVSQHSYNSVDSLQNSINNQQNSLKLEITQSKAAVDRDLQLLKQQMLEKLESNFAQLSASKLSRQDLAEVLFELCLQLKNPSLTVDAAENNQGETRSATADKSNGKIILPEQN